jgi:hypothetical protein
VIQYARGNNPSQNIDGKRLQDILQNTATTDEQQKVKIAFAEGLPQERRLFSCSSRFFLGYVAAAGEPKPKERPSLFKAIRVVLFYGILIMLILNIISAMSGGGRC